MVATLNGDVTHCSHVSESAKHECQAPISASGNAQLRHGFCGISTCHQISHEDLECLHDCLADLQGRIERIIGDTKKRGINGPWDGKLVQKLVIQRTEDYRKRVKQAEGVTKQRVSVATQTKLLSHNSRRPCATHPAMPTQHKSVGVFLSVAVREHR